MKFKIGETVMCINGQPGYLTIGKKYTILEYSSLFKRDQDSEFLVKIIGDRGERISMLEDRFVKIYNKIDKLMEEVL